MQETYCRKTNEQFADTLTFRYRFPAINMAKSLNYFSYYKKVITLGENRAQEQYKPRRCLSVY